MRLHTSIKRSVVGPALTGFSGGLGVLSFMAMGADQRTDAAFVVTVVFLLSFALDHVQHSSSILVPSSVPIATTL